MDSFSDSIHSLYLAVMMPDWLKLSLIIFVATSPLVVISLRNMKKDHSND